MAQKKRKKFEKWEKEAAISSYYDDHDYQNRAKKTAKKYGVHPRTIEKWVKAYADAKRAEYEAKQKAEKEARTKALKEAGLELKCPHCGNDDDESFSHWEDVIAIRSVHGFDLETGVLIMDGSYSTEAGQGGDEWLVCGACYKKLPIPDVEVEYS